MKKLFRLLLVLIMVITVNGSFYKVKAASSYSVEMVSSSAGNKVVGKYSSYSEALKVMDSQNSTATSVATIYRDGVPVDSKYAIFKFKPSGKNTYALYRNYNSSSQFTSINSSYGIDAAVLGYSDNGRVKIMMSGFVGWTNVSNGVVTPVSLLGSQMVNISGNGVRLRSSASLNGSIITSLSGSYNFNYSSTANADGYTWYKVSYNGKDAWVAGGKWLSTYSSSLGTYYKHYGPSGNLIHHFTTYGGVKYNDAFTNLGKAPSYMVKDKWYYSFDGNYFYADLTKMLSDYRKGIYTSSINPNNPHYSYYMYLPSRSKTAYTAADLDRVIKDAGYTSSTSKMYGTGQYFKDAEAKYGTNALLAFSAAMNESNWGTSKIAKDKNNLFGYGAADSCAYECAYSYASPKDSIMDYASKSSASYENATGKYYNGSHYGNKSSGKNIYYATDPYWGEVMASNAFNRDLKFGGKDFNSNTLGITKKGISGVKVYKEASQSSTVLYTMKNPKRSDAVYDFAVNIVGEVTSGGVKYYKIYTDLAAGNTQYGYVVASNFNITKAVPGGVTVVEPVITATDKEVIQYTSFDYKAGVSAKEGNTDLTSKITYTGSVDLNKVGTYNITYSVVGSSKTVSKTIKVNVKANEKPVINASDMVVNQNATFNPLDLVKATDKEDGDITKNIKVTKNTVNTKVLGTYEVTYEVADKANQKVSKTIKVTVQVKQIKESNGEFYLDYLKVVNGNLQIKGYNIIKDENNTLNTNIKYELILKDVNGNQTVLPLTRITNTKDMTWMIKGQNGKDYTYSWFVGNINVKDIKQGDYTLYVKATSDDYYSYKVVQNMLLNDQVTQYNKDGKFVTITNDYTSSDVPVHFTVRDKELGMKQTSFDTNQYSYLEDLSFKDNKLHLKGAAYSVDLDMRSNAKLERKLIFENTTTYEQFSYDLSYVTKGSFEVNLLSADKFGKAKQLAWYDKDIDISNLPKGKYAIYVSNKGNISDYGELSDILLYVDYSKATANINGKNYKFSLNNKLRDRVELEVK